MAIINSQRLFQIKGSIYQIATFLCCLLLTLPTLAQKVNSPPNIVVFLVDDMGWQDTSVPFHTNRTPFNERYRTPNMERLAAKGAKFTNAYTFPVCTPTRVSLITGTNPARHRITHWTSPNKDTNTDYADNELQSVNWNVNGVSPISGVKGTFEATPLPILLKQAGYFTVQSGKAHFGSTGTPGADPLQLGFDVNIAGSSIGHPASYYGKDNYDRPKNGKPNRNAVPGLEKYHGTDTFLSDAITLEALNAIEKPIASKQPFFLYLSHYAVHTPIDPDPRFVDRYLQMGLHPIEANYASLVEGMDKSLGDLLDYLDAKGQTENTVIFFLSDNGGLSTPPLRGGEGYTHNLPLRAGKGSVYEGGIRVPFIAKWPGVAPEGQVVNQYIMAEDIFPTVLELASVKKPVMKQKVDGESIVPYLKNSKRINAKRTLVWHHPHRWIPDEGPNIHWASALRQGDWKLIYDYRGMKLELYNLKMDIGETTDLASSNPKKVKELARLLTKKLKEYDAQLPLWKQTGKPVLWPDELNINGK